MSTKRIHGSRAPLELIWDKTGIAHVFAQNIEDAYRGLGYAAASERLWQIHQSCAYANCEAAALLGERFVAQDLIQSACNVHGRDTGLIDSPGDELVDAYLDGMNSYVDELTELPPEFAYAGATPRHFTRADIAARYRFTAWFQHKSWTEKIMVGRLMATHGVDYFKDHLLNFTDDDAELIGMLKDQLTQLSPAAMTMIYPEVGNRALLGGSNNWAVTGHLTASGTAMLATDPHQAHTIPNTFFYAHLHAGDFDVFGEGFPGVPYFMFGRTPHLAWGLTTGFIDNYDLYIEKIENNASALDGGWQPVLEQETSFAVKNGEDKQFTIKRTAHGPLLEHLTDQLGLTTPKDLGFQTALHWSLTDTPTSAGTLAQLPMARNAQEFGDALFEDDVCPLVNNIICVDRDNGLRRFIATTMPARRGISGNVPLPGWLSDYNFPLSKANELTVEINPDKHYAHTANNDTMGSTGPYPIHNFATHSARADRIQELLEEGQNFTVDDFKQMQLDQKDLRAKDVLQDLVPILRESDNQDALFAADLLSEWDYSASVDSAPACIFYPFLDRFWARRFMREVLSEDLMSLLPAGAPGLERFDIKNFLTPDSPWQQHRATLVEHVARTMGEVVNAVKGTLGEDPTTWRWGNLHQIEFAHRLVKHDSWSHMTIGPEPIGGSGTTLNMAMHFGRGPGRAKPGEVPCHVMLGPAFRMVVDLAEQDRIHLAIAGGNGGRPDSEFSVNQYPTWFSGEFYEVMLEREEIDEARVILFE